MVAATLAVASPADRAGAGEAARPAVTVYPAPKGSPLSNRWTVSVGGRKLDVYGYRGHAANFAICDIAGEVAVTAVPKFSCAKLSVHPLAKGIRAAKRKECWIFSVKKPCSLTLIVDGNYMKEPLHLFLNPPAPETPAGAVVFNAGKHVLKKPIVLKSGQTLHLAGGAWVEGVVRCRNAKNVTVQGSGILSQGSKETSGLVFVKCRDVRLSGILETKTGRGWCTVLSQCSGVKVSNYHVIGVAQPTTDGLNPCNSQDVTVEDSFFRSHDDCIAIKGNSGGHITKKTPVVPPDTQPPVENITVRRCQFWSTYNNVLCIGAETRAKYFRNIRLEDCDVLYHRKYWRKFGTFSILPLHGTVIEKIAFDNLRVEYTESKLFCFKFGETLYGAGIPGNHSFPGGIRDVRIRNVSVLRQVGGARSEFSGLDAGKRVENVRIENLRFGGKVVRTRKDMGLVCNRHTAGIAVAAAKGE
jgi:hypothetical protein